jgi:hypothetical protein
LLVAAALFTYILAGTHLACAEACFGHDSESISAVDTDDNGAADLEAAHCHVAHLQGGATAETALRMPAMTGVHTANVEPRAASADRLRAERPPRP